MKHQVPGSSRSRRLWAQRRFKSHLLHLLPGKGRTEYDRCQYHCPRLGSGPQHVPSSLWPRRKQVRISLHANVSPGCGFVISWTTRGTSFSLLLRSCLLYHVWGGGWICVLKDVSTQVRQRKKDHKNPGLAVKMAVMLDILPYLCAGPYHLSGQTDFNEIARYS